MNGIVRREASFSFSRLGDFETRSPQCQPNYKTGDRCRYVSAHGRRYGMLAYICQLLLTSLPALERK